jgi:hypothetical protein
VPRGDGRLTHDLLPGEKGPQDACGVFGVWAPGEEVAKLTYYGLYALQHRGQESAGIATSDGQRLLVYKDMGLVSQVFDERSLASLRGHLAVGHCRYSTTGGSTWENAQPTLGGHDGGTVALAHNGNLINSAELRDLVEERAGLAGHPGEVGRGNTTDTALVTALLADDPDRTLEDAALDVLPRLRGAFCFVFMNEQTLYAARDPQGIRPLVLGRLDRGWVVASETAALDIVGASFIREIEPGELLAIDADGLRSRRFAPKDPKGCVFEYVYLARPDTTINRDAGRDRGVPITYAAAGVDVEAGDKAVELMKESVRRRHPPEVLGGLGGFAGLFDASAIARMARPILATSTDGVGTKVAIAQALDIHDTIGFDLVGMVVDDIVVCGAEPLFMTDYIATGKVVPERIAAIVGGIARACEQAGVALVGGETAEHPGLLDPDEYDVRRRRHRGRRARRHPQGRTGSARRRRPRPRSSGLHSNGYSLVRRVIAHAGWALDRGRCRVRAHARRGAAHPHPGVCRGPARPHPHPSVVRRRARPLARHRRRARRQPRAGAAAGSARAGRPGDVDAASGLRHGRRTRQCAAGRPRAHAQPGCRLRRARPGRCRGRDHRVSGRARHTDVGDGPGPRRRPRPDRPRPRGHPRGEGCRRGLGLVGVHR